MTPEETFKTLVQAIAAIVSQNTALIAKVNALTAAYHAATFPRRAPPARASAG